MYTVTARGCRVLVYSGAGGRTATLRKRNGGRWLVRIVGEGRAYGQVVAGFCDGCAVAALWTGGE